MWVYIDSYIFKSCDEYINTNINTRTLFVNIISNILIKLSSKCGIMQLCKQVSLPQEFGVLNEDIGMNQIIRNIIGDMNNKCYSNKRKDLLKYLKLVDDTELKTFIGVKYTKYIIIIIKNDTKNIENKCDVG